MKFELKNVMAALDNVPPKKYMRLAVNLGLRTHEVKTFEEDNNRNCERVLIAIVDSWMCKVTDPKPSWQSLDEALRTLNKTS